MFAGIVEELGLIEAFDRKEGGGARMTVAAPLLSRECKIGDSISVNGVCLTVEKKRKRPLKLRPLRGNTSSNRSWLSSGWQYD